MTVWQPGQGIGSCQTRQALLILSPLGDISGNLCESDQLASLISNGIDDNVRPEYRPIFANPLSLHFKSTILGRDTQRLVRMTCSPGGFEVKLGEMLTDDFVCLVPYEPLCAGVPGRHDPCRVQHTKGIIADAVHQKPELQLALHERLSHPVPICDVTADVGESQKFARVISN